MSKLGKRKLEKNLPSSQPRHLRRLPSDDLDIIFQCAHWPESFNDDSDSTIPPAQQSNIEGSDNDSVFEISRRESFNHTDQVSYLPVIWRVNLCRIAPFSGWNERQKKKTKKVDGPLFGTAHNQPRLQISRPQISRPQISRPQISRPKILTWVSDGVNSSSQLTSGLSYIIVRVFRKMYASSRIHSLLPRKKWSPSLMHGGLHHG